MAIEFKGNLADKPLIHGGGGNEAYEMLQRVCWFWELPDPPTLFLPELKAQLSSRLWVINSHRPSRVIVPAQVMQFDRCEIERATQPPVVTMVKGSPEGERRLRVLPCPRCWPSRGLIEALQRGPDAVIAVDVSWVCKGSTPSEMSKVFAEGSYRRFRGLTSPKGPPQPIMLWIHNPLHDAAQAEIDAAFLQAREQRRKP